ncbi:hypothetical protein AAFF_G00070640 [Aldrovandia affinis]|uniref:Uncharacterized protein n=1 Tax=Aldrovandia affinis TaxID=143900 RepID=A0AAD7RYV9_9TELE|nr:hypothetical protein AAFF_G00070640 [Aldrovandia affinis]
MNIQPSSACKGGAVFPATGNGNGKTAIFLYPFEPLQEGEKGIETFYFPKYLVLGPNVVVARDRQIETEHSVNEWSRRKTDSHHPHDYFNRSQKN